MEDNSKKDFLKEIKGLPERLSQAVNLAGGKRKTAEITGISEAQIYRYIKGESQPTIEPLLKICAAAGLSLNWLIENKGPMKMPEEGFSSTNADETKIRYSTHAQIDPDLFYIIGSELIGPCLGNEFYAFPYGQIGQIAAEIYNEISKLPEKRDRLSAIAPAVKAAIEKVESPAKKKRKEIQAREEKELLKRGPIPFSQVLMQWDWGEKDTNTIYRFDFKKGLLSGMELGIQFKYNFEPKSDTTTGVILTIDGKDWSFQENKHRKVPGISVTKPGGHQFFIRNLSF